MRTLTIALTVLLVGALVAGVWAADDNEGPSDRPERR